MSFPKKGKFFPEASTDLGNGHEAGRFSTEIAVALRRSAAVNGAGVKVVAGWTGANEKTVKNWFSGRYGPSGEHLVVLVCHSGEVLSSFLKMAGREDLVASLKLAATENAVLELLAAVRRLSAPAIKLSAADK